MTTAGPRRRAHDKLHVTANRATDVHYTPRQVVTRESPGPPAAPAQAGVASHSDLGPGCALQGLRPRSPPAVAPCCPEPARSRGSGVCRRDLRVERRMKRGEVWTAAGGPDYAGKPRPVVVVQDDRFEHT